MSNRLGAINDYISISARRRWRTTSKSKVSIAKSCLVKQSLFFSYKTLRKEGLQNFT